MTEIEELRERERLLARIKELEESGDWTDIDELRERARLHETIHEGEK